MITSTTTHEVKCDQCTFSRTFPTMKEAKAVEERHKGYHRDFKLGTRVLTPILRGMDPTKPGKITTIYSDYEEIYVTLDGQKECFECKTHRHFTEDWWRGKISEVVKI